MQTDIREQEREIQEEFTTFHSLSPAQKAALPTMRELQEAFEACAVSLTQRIEDLNIIIDMTEELDRKNIEREIEDCRCLADDMKFSAEDFEEDDQTLSANWAKRYNSPPPDSAADEVFHLEGTIEERQAAYEAELGDLMDYWETGDDVKYGIETAGSREGAVVMKSAFMEFLPERTRNQFLPRAGGAQPGT